MPRINVLDISVANLIAAGEVVERPASVVKELLENSVDAGASVITVEIKRGGIAFIRVADNGCGIAREDAPVALKRHATSKIHTAADLASIMTLGFRGEALAAISSVARVRIITRTREESAGTLLESDPDGEVTVSDSGAPVGTTVIVEELFANVPARLKFLKKDASEGMAVTAIIEKLALSRPDIAIRYISEGAVKFETAGTGRLEDAIYAVLGREFAKKLVPVDDMTEGVSVGGFVGAPESARGNRNYENIFINGRYVKSLTVSTAVEQAFESYIPADKFPVCVLGLSVHPTQVDVNVHPTKLEVKFSNERAVFEAVYCAVRNALEYKLPRVKLDTPRVKLTGDDLGAVAEVIAGRLDGNEQDGDTSRGDLPPETGALHSQGTPAAGPAAPARANAAPPAASRGYTLADSDTHGSAARPPEQGGTPQAVVAPWMPDVPEGEVLPAPQDEPHTTPEIVSQSASQIAIQAEPQQAGPPQPSAPASLGPDPAFRVAGIVFNCYIIVEAGDRVIIIDKHAAHERILFEDMKKRMRSEGGDPSQLLFIPVELRLSPQENAAVGEFSAEFAALGFGYSELDGGGTGLFQIPANLTADAAAELFGTLAAALAEGSGTPRSERDALYERALYTASCKAAMKAGREDGGSEALYWLCQRVLTSPEIRVCPHGRPVSVETNKYGLEKLFGRA